MSKNTTAEATASIAGAKYLGGFRFATKQIGGSLSFTTDTMGVDPTFRKRGKFVHAKTEFVTKVVIGSDTSEIVTVYGGGTVGGRSTTTVEIHLSTGDVGYFTVSEPPVKVKAAMAPWLNLKGIELEEKS